MKKAAPPAFSLPLQPPPPASHEDARLREELLQNLTRAVGKFPEVATPNDWYLAAAYTVRDRVMSHWVESSRTYYEQKARTVCYLSAEFLIGPQLGMNLLRLGIEDQMRRAVSGLGLEFDDLIEQEEEPGLGNGGLGRLAACFMESLATLQVPSIGYGIRYEFGIFDQEIRGGWQVEVADSWLRFGNPWEIPRPEIRFDVMFGGRTQPYEEDGKYRVRWLPGNVVKGTPFDTPILGCGVPTANMLRLWKAEASESFDFQTFNVGDYYGAVAEKVDSETITKVLYPNDAQQQGKELRLKQQYFFVSCALQDMLRLHLQRERTPLGFADKFAAQLNDTHPSLAIAELMRLLVDEHRMDWEPAWDITQRTFAYTNHTLLPEALERWSIDLMRRLLPRPLEIIFEINQRFLDQVRAAYPGDEARVQRMSLVDETGERYVRMANLACVGSHAINGVAELHTKLLARDVLPAFHEMMPAKFSNKTNGITPRRFLRLCNPRLSRLITETIGSGWLRELSELRQLELVGTDASFQAKWRQAKQDNKQDLARYIERVTGLGVDPASLFDVQAKRIHEYKRQHLNLLHAITLYNRLKNRKRAREAVPRTVIFAGKAAPGYFMAKLIVKLANAVGETIDRHPALRGLLKVVFIPDFNVKTAQRIYPAADLSEQISTAGKEASGTGNMKMALNGALTIGTLDGANVEIREQVGAENFFLFGLTAEQVFERQREGYVPRSIAESNRELRAALDQIADGAFSPDQPDLFHPLVDSLLEHDPFMVLADYAAYVECQERVERAYLDQTEWTRVSILNVARMGHFSSDRSIRDYCRDIWKVPVK
ncbi:MAG: glycogen/starch/alpha-glucan phosphorylase [Gemmatimonadaceae bacterium]